MEVRTCVKVQMCRKTSLRFIGQPGKRNRNKLLEEKSAKRAVKKSDGKQETVGWTGTGTPFQLCCEWSSPGTQATQGLKGKLK